MTAPLRLLRWRLHLEMVGTSDGEGASIVGCRATVWKVTGHTARQQRVAALYCPRVTISWMLVGKRRVRSWLTEARPPYIAQLV